MISRTSMPTASPASGSLPLHVTIAYGMSSTAPPEQATVRYSLDSGNDVCFQAGGHPAKEVVVHHQVVANLPASQPFSDRLSLVACPGAHDLSIVIQQAISDGSGLPPLIASCRIQIT